MTTHTGRWPYAADEPVPYLLTDAALAVLDGHRRPAGGTYHRERKPTVIRKLLLLVIAAWVVYYVATSPQTAAGELRQLGGMLAGTANAIAAFGQALSGS
jgi:peptidoglycan/LPS O-acetylase OafA/YrhL